MATAAPLPSSIFPVVQALTGAGLTIIVLTLRLARGWQRRTLTAAYETGRQDGAVGDSPAGKGSLRSPSGRRALRRTV